MSRMIGSYQYAYARQKLWTALYIMVGAGSMRSKLAHAHAVLSILRPHDLPEDLREKFSVLMADLGKRVIKLPLGSGLINAKRPKSTEMAHVVLSLYTQLRGGI